MHALTFDLPPLAPADHTPPRSIAAILPAVLARYGISPEDSVADSSDRPVALSFLIGESQAVAPALVSH